MLVSLELGLALGSDVALMEQMLKLQHKNRHRHRFQNHVHPSKLSCSPPMVPKLVPVLRRLACGSEKALEQVMERMFPHPDNVPNST
jgi:hypothetical protein